MFENDTGICPNCGLASAFKEEGKDRVWPRYLHNAWTYGDNKWVGTVVLKCLHCEQTLLLRDVWVNHSTEYVDSEDELIDRVLVYPESAPRELDSVVPEPIRSFFREASQCEQAGALRGASVLYRAAVEELVNDQGATGANLYERIENLKNGAAADLVDDFHEARMLGNDSIHDGLVYSTEEVDDIANLIEEAIVVLYVQPAERRRLRQSRQNRRSKSDTTA